MTDRPAIDLKFLFRSRRCRIVRKPWNKGLFSEVNLYSNRVILRKQNRYVLCLPWNNRDRTDWIHNNPSVSDWYWCSVSDKGDCLDPTVFSWYPHRNHREWTSDGSPWHRSQSHSGRRCHTRASFPGDKDIRLWLRWFSPSGTAWRQSPRLLWKNGNQE